MIEPTQANPLSTRKLSNFMTTKKMFSVDGKEVTSSAEYRMLVNASSVIVNIPTNAWFWAIYLHDP